MASATGAILLKIHFMAQSYSFITPSINSDIMSAALFIEGIIESYDKKEEYVGYIRSCIYRATSEISIINGTQGDFTNGSTGAASGIAKLGKAVQSLAGNFEGCMTLPKKLSDIITEQGANLVKASEFSVGMIKQVF
jgi:hypothetical protein